LFGIAAVSKRLSLPRALRYLFIRHHPSIKTKQITVTTAAGTELLQSNSKATPKLLYIDLNLAGKEGNLSGGET